MQTAAAAMQAGGLFEDIVDRERSSRRLSEMGQLPLPSVLAVPRYVPRTSPTHSLDDKRHQGKRGLQGSTHAQENGEYKSYVL